MTRETVGKISSDLLVKAVDDTHSAHEQMQECLTDYDNKLLNTIDIVKKQMPSCTFYIEVITKKERLMRNVLRCYMKARVSCPTPDFDQIAYEYDHTLDKINFLWVVPCPEACYQMLSDPLSVPLEERQLLNYVLDYADGTLLKLAKEKSGEI